MAFWENFSETITIKSKEMADKAKNFTDIAGLKGQIVSYENTISRLYKDIGRAYYQDHMNDSQAEYTELMTSIKNAEKTIKDLNKRIAELKGTRKCSSCGYEVPDESTFCLRCGSKLDETSVYCEANPDIVTDVVVTEIIDE